MGFFNMKVFLSYVLTGIEEAFLEVAKRLIKLYETSPTSGLQTTDPNDSAVDQDDRIHIDPPSRNTDPPPQSNQSRCSC